MNRTKKTGILTQPLGNNYGGLLQNYALQKVLKDLGYNPLTLSISFPERNRYYQFLRSLCVNFYNKFILGKEVDSVIPFIPKKRDLRIISKNMQSFIKCNIKTTEPLVIKKLKQDNFLRDFSAFIVGSDQVWRPRYSPNLTTYYLDFLPKEITAKRIAYAASFGVDNWEYSKWQTTTCKKLLHHFDAISVREDSGVNLCKKYLDVDAIHLLDPTLLLDKKDYLNLVKTDKQKVSRSLMVYVLDMNSDKLEIIDTVSNHLNLSVNSVMPERELSYLYNEDINKCVFPPVEEWINGFNEADFVITDSFHGTVLAIIFNKPFISIANKGRGTSRFNSLLDKLNLTERLIDEKEALFSDLLENEIDYLSVNKVLNELKKESIEYISSALT